MSVGRSRAGGARVAHPFPRLLHFPRRWLAGLGPLFDAEAPCWLRTHSAGWIGQGPPSSRGVAGPNPVAIDVSTWLHVFRRPHRATTQPFQNRGVHGRAHGSVRMADGGNRWKYLANVAGLKQ